jgi:hypothetical protein
MKKLKNPITDKKSIQTLLTPKPYYCPNKKMLCNQCDYYKRCKFTK